MDEKFSNVLRNLLEEHGSSLLKNPGRIKAYLSDYFPDRKHKGQIKALLMAIEEGLVDEIRGSSSTQLSQHETDRLARLLEENAAIKGEIAAQAVAIWCSALGKASPTQALSITSPAEHVVQPGFEQTESQATASANNPQQPELRKIGRQTWRCAASVEQRQSSLSTASVGGCFFIILAVVILITFIMNSME